MKKLSKLVAAATVAMLVVPCAVVFASCAKTETVNGDYSYEQYGSTYGFKVIVEVQTDEKGDRIRKVTIDDTTGYAATSPESMYPDAAKWNSNVQSLLNSYRGLYVDDVLAKTVALNGDVPLASDESGFVDFGEEVIITGATQSSGRLLLAVQDALKNFRK